MTDYTYNEWAEESWIELYKAMEKAGNAQYGVVIPAVLLLFGGIFALAMIFPSNPVVGVPLMIAWFGGVGYYTKKLYSSVWDKIMAEFQKEDNLRFDKVMAGFKKDEEE